MLRMLLVFFLKTEDNELTEIRAATKTDKLSGIKKNNLPEIYIYEIVSIFQGFIKAFSS